MARPEASMAEGYVKDECLGFITEYLQRFEVSIDECGMPMKNTEMQRRLWRGQGQVFS